MILVVDHYDSFVYNLVQLVGGFGFQTVVVRSDTQTGAQAVALEPDAVILSPGPGRPEDAGCMLELIEALPARTPLLGVCLGHQALGVAFGGTIDRAPKPVHGKASLIRHSGTGLFAGLPDPFEAGRYHSLVIQRDDVPEDLVVTAETEDGLVMAVEHRSLPRFGLQFHPESILTPNGPQIVRNFLELTGDARPTLQPRPR
jgi:anthranilate synthase/aminodeoxychorismate synthase-like glutamine amidotransferase